MERICEETGTQSAWVAGKKVKAQEQEGRFPTAVCVLRKSGWQLQEMMKPILCSKDYKFRVVDCKSCSSQDDSSFSWGFCPAGDMGMMGPALGHLVNLIGSFSEL